MGALINRFGYDARIVLSDGTKVFFETQPPEQMGWLVVGKGDRAVLPDSLTTVGRAVAAAPDHKDWILERTDFGISLLKEEAAAIDDRDEAEPLLDRAAELQLQLEAVGTDWDDDTLAEITRPKSLAAIRTSTQQRSRPALLPRTEIIASSGGELLVHTTDEHPVKIVDLEDETAPGAVIVNVEGEQVARLDWTGRARALTVKCRGNKLLVKLRFDEGAERRLEIVLPPL